MGTVFLSQLSATTELLVIDLITQQDPESDPRLPLSLFPDLSAPACAGKNAATPHPCEPHAPPLHTTENEEADSLVCSNRPVVVGRGWSVHWGYLAQVHIIGLVRIRSEP